MNLDKLSGLKLYEPVDTFSNDYYRNRFYTVLQAANLCVFVVDMKNRLYVSIDNAESIFGISDEEVLKDVRKFDAFPPNDYAAAISEYFSHPDDKSVIASAFYKVMEGERVTYTARMRARGSDFKWCRIDACPVLDRGNVYMLGVVSDIDDLKRRADKWKEMAFRDPFTGLFNKSAVESMIRSILNENRKSRHALLLVDIDHFKDINDTLGHAEGDRVLVNFAKKLQGLFRSSDIIGRFGGDEFIAFIRDVSNINFLEKRILKILEKDSECCNISVSVGVAVFPYDAQDYESLFNAADVALYKAKLIRNACAFSSDKIKVITVD